jgi:hypothetical protein
VFSCVLLLLAVLEQLTSRIGSAVSGLKDKLEPALKAAGGLKADVLATLLEPLQDTTGAAASALSSVSVVLFPSDPCRAQQM